VPGAPVQATRRRACGVLTAQAPKRLACGDRLTSRHQRTHRFVLGADSVSVEQHHDASAGDRRAEPDDTRSGSQNQPMLSHRQIHPAVPGRIRRGGWSKGREDPRYPCDR